MTSNNIKVGCNIIENYMKEIAMNELKKEQFFQDEIQKRLYAKENDQEMYFDESMVDIINLLPA